MILAELTKKGVRRDRKRSNIFCHCPSMFKRRHCILEEPMISCLAALSYQDPINKLDFSKDLKCFRVNLIILQELTKNSVGGTENDQAFSMSLSFYVNEEALYFRRTKDFSNGLKWLRASNANFEINTGKILQIVLNQYMLQ